MSWVFLTGATRTRSRSPSSCRSSTSAPCACASTIAARSCASTAGSRRELYLAVVPIGGTRAAPARRAQARVRVRRQDARVSDGRAARPAARREPRADTRRSPSSAPGSRNSTAGYRRFAASPPTRPARPRCATSTSSRAISAADAGPSSRLCALGPSSARHELAPVFARRAAARRPSRVPRRPALAEPAVARRRDHGVRRARVRPQAARDRRRSARPRSSRWTCARTAEPTSRTSS